MTTKTTIKCMLVDDEPPAINLLKSYTDHIDHLEVVATTHNVMDAGKILKTDPIDLIFLDIQMPVLNGIDFLKSLKNPPAVIITTAHREYALEGYDLDIIDYLLKPIPFDRFYKAVQRYEEREATKKSTPNSTPTDEPDHIFVNINRVNHKLILKDILYVESLKDYVRIHLVNSHLVVKGNLGSMMKLLPTTSFIRIHRSFAIALAQVQAYTQTEVTVADKQLPIGLSYREEFFERF